MTLKEFREHCNVYKVEYTVIGTISGYRKIFYDMYNASADEITEVLTTLADYEQRGATVGIFDVSGDRLLVDIIVNGIA